MAEVAQAALSDRYRLEARIAKGGMGVVHRAYDEILGRPVAVKVLAADLADNPEFIERFRREARSAAMLLHPNIAGIFDYGHDAEHWYMVMELVEGEDLAARLKRAGRLDWPSALALGQHVAAALVHAHARGLVHRDIKPGNILICSDGTAKVTDFGIALAARATTTLTQTGTALGTPYYMAPEQAKGEQVGPAADLYALGVVLFECLTGERPYQADSGIALAMQHVTAPIPDPRERGVALPTAVAELVTRCMAKEPAGRYVSASALREALGSVLDGPAPAAAPTSAKDTVRAASQDPAGPAAATAEAAGPTGTADHTTAPMPATGAIDPTMGPFRPSPRPEGARMRPPPGSAPVAGTPGRGGRAAPRQGPARPAAAPRPAAAGWGPPPPQAAATAAGRAAPPGQAHGAGRDRVPSAGGDGDVRLGRGRALALAFAAAFLIVAAFLVGMWVDGDRGGATDPPADVRGRIPIGLVGTPYQAAQSRLLEIGYPSSLELQHSETVPQYHVIKSDPDEGSKRSPGESVTLYVSIGPAAKATVPGGLLGKDYAQVSERLLQAGFAVERAEDYSDVYDSGEVMEVRPAEGSLEEPGSTVEVTVSLGSKDSSSSDPSSSDPSSSDPSLSDSSSESGID
jgi:hypothetical protein